MAGIAYFGVNGTQAELDHWFGEGVVTDQHEVVKTYRDETEMTSAVSFKLVTFPKTTNLT